VELRPYQAHALSALWDWFRRNPQGAPLLVLPTGAGKSVIIAEVARKVAERGLDRRVLVLQHRKELIGQNCDKFRGLAPFVTSGVYSAGLGRKEADAQVVFAGVQSVFKKAEQLGKFSLCVIDEAHLIPATGEGMYRTLIDGLTDQNPAVRFCGLTATPYRMGSGFLTGGTDGLFTAVAYDANIADLIGQGYLSPLVSKACKHQADLSGVAVRAGEFVAEAMERAFNRLDLVEAALEELVSLARDRRSWLVFASGVNHAHRIAQVLKRVGVSVGVVTGDTPPLEREMLLTDFKAGRLRAMVNCDVLTTGFDHPGIDFIGVLRATKSTGLWVQICGRGCRLAEGKKDCLIADFGGNAFRHGPLDRIKITYRKCPLTGREEGRVESPPMKLCPNCRSVAEIKARECPDCGAPFPEPERIRHEATASDAPLLSSQVRPVEVEVFGTSYARHEKRDSPVPTLRADHTIIQLGDLPVSKVSEWVCLEHEGFALRKAKDWWVKRTTDPTQDYPDSVDEGLRRAKAGELKAPKRVRIAQEKGFWRVVEVLEYHPENHVQAEERDLLYEEGGINI
jgi:DNA repair protein RadD